LTDQKFFLREEEENILDNLEFVQIKVLPLHRFTMRSKLSNTLNKPLIKVKK